MTQAKKLYRGNVTAYVAKGSYGGSPDAESPARLSRPGRGESATEIRVPGRRFRDPECVQHPFSWRESGGAGRPRQSTGCRTRVD